MSGHISVLTNEVVTGLDLRPGDTVVDCTLGSGGHAKALIPCIGTTGVYLGIDADGLAIETQSALLNTYANVRLVHDNFKHLTEILNKAHISSVQAILADLGWRSEQFESGEKGFSFATDEPLLMTYGEKESYPFTAYDIANEWDESSIADIVYGYGEERFSRRIAHAIVSARTEGEIKTSKQLADIVTSALPYTFRKKRIHPATKTFQAFRIAVNDELGALKQLLSSSIPLLAPQGRMAIITFHSIEDRIVKRFFKEQTHDHVVKQITKKPIVPSKAELEQNPRARSAKLRIIEKL